MAFPKRRPLLRRNTERNSTLEKDLENYEYWKLMKGHPILKPNASLRLTMFATVKVEPEDPLYISSLDETQSTSPVQAKIESVEDDKPSELEKLLMTTVSVNPKEQRKNVEKSLGPPCKRFSIGIQCKPKTAVKSTNYNARKLEPLMRLVPKPRAASLKSSQLSSGAGSKDVKDGDSRCKECDWAIKEYQWWCMQCAHVRCGACAQRAAHRSHIILRVPVGSVHKHTQAAIASIKRHLVNHSEQRSSVEDDATASVNVLEKPEVKAEHLTIETDPFLEGDHSPDHQNGESQESSTETDQDEKSAGSDYVPNQSEDDSPDSEYRDLCNAKEKDQRPPPRKRPRRVQVTRTKNVTAKKKYDRPQRLPTTSQQDLGTVNKNAQKRIKQKKAQYLIHSEQKPQRLPTTSQQDLGTVNKNAQKRAKQEKAQYPIHSEQNKDNAKSDHDRSYVDNTSEPTRNWHKDDSEDISYEDVEYLLDIEELT